jgi:O-antigen ligase
MPAFLRQSLLPLYLLACLLLGGSSRAPWPNMALQLGAVAILAWAALARPRLQVGRAGVQLSIIIAAALALTFVQLMPLPPALWNALPGRDAIARGFDLLGEPRPWLPLSLAPYDTLASALWLLPPLAIIAGMLRPGAYRTAWMTVAVVLASIAGVILGTLQIASTGPDSPWYLYSITNIGSLAGLFANSNHMATLLVATLPFLVALYGPGRRGSPPGAHSAAGQIAILGGAMLVVLLGLLLNRSLAGLALGLVALGASALVRTGLERRRARWGLAAVAAGALIAVAAILASPAQNNLTASGARTDYSSRYTSFSNSLHATADLFPAGSGIGSFADVYPAYENPAWVDRWYVNHVHNDYIELALETGLPGMLLIAAFILWWIQRTVAIWRAPAIDPYARAATIASGAILLHSLVDFPLRSTGIAALFAFCLALMVGARRRPAVELPAEGHPNGARHLSIG